MTDTKIDQSELDYHRKLLERIRWANTAREQIAGVEAATQSWSAHLAEKYDLPPGAIVDGDGQIVTEESP